MGVCLLLVIGGCDRSQRNSQAYPARQITLVVPFGPGGGTDTYARIFKQAIEQEDLLPVPLVVINQGGAGGTIGSRRVKDAEPDGYTMMVIHDAILTAKLAGQVDYSHEAFEPIAATSEVGMVIAVKQGSRFDSLDALMQAAADQPDTIRFGANRGALTHFAGLQLEALKPGAQFRYAQIGGGAERFANLKAGHIDVTGFSIEEFVRFREGELDGLCFFDDTRHAAAPNVPTAKEQGYDLVNRNTFYWWFPKGTPKERIRYMRDVLQKAVASPHVVEKLTEIHCQPIFVTGRPVLKRLEESERELARVQATVDNPVAWLPNAILAFVVLCGLMSVLTTRRASRVHGDTESTDDNQAKTGPSNDEAAMEEAAMEEAVLETAEPRGARYGLAMAMATLVVAYVVGLAFGVDFRLATGTFVAVASISLNRSSPRAILIACGCAAVVALGVYWLFTEFFVIDLPSS